MAYPAAELVTNSETLQVEFRRTSLKNLDWRKNHLVIQNALAFSAVLYQRKQSFHRLQLGFFVLLTFNHLKRRSPGGWIHGRSGGWNHVLGRCFAAGGQARKMRKRRVDGCLVWKFSWVQLRKHKWEDFWNIEGRVQSFSWIFRWFPCWWRVLTPHCQLMIIECLSSPSAWDFHHFGSHVHA